MWPGCATVGPDVWPPHLSLQSSFVSAPCCCVPDTTMSEINQALLREEEGLVANRGMVSCYVGAGGTVPAAVLNENQVFRMYVTPELRRQYDNTLLAEVESVS